MLNFRMFPQQQSRQAQTNLQQQPNRPMQMFPQQQPNRPMQMPSQQQQSNRPMQMPSQQQQNRPMQMPSQQQQSNRPMQMPSQQQSNRQMQMPSQQQANRQMSMFPQQQQNGPMQMPSQKPQESNRQMPMFPQQQQNGPMPIPPLQQQQPNQQMPGQQQPQAIDPVIQFEPFSESMLAPVPAVTPTPTTLPTPDLVPDNAITEKLSRLMQNERNASIYYQNLANLSPHQQFATKLTRAVESAKQHLDSCNEIYKSYQNTHYEPKEEKIIKNVGFYEGIRMAISEEHDSLNELSDLYDSIHEEKNLWLLNSILYKKLGLLSHLHAMNHMMWEQPHS